MPWRTQGRTGGAPTRRPGLGGGKAKLIMMLVIAALPVLKYAKSCKQNPYTGRRQAVAWTPEEEVQLGMRAAPQMIDEHGGEFRNP